MENSKLVTLKDWIVEFKKDSTEYIEDIKEDIKNDLIDYDFFTKNTIAEIGDEIQLDAYNNINMTEISLSDWHEYDDSCSYREDFCDLLTDIFNKK